MGMQTSLCRERQILLSCDSPFIVRLFRTFNSADTVHFLMEACLGGELYAVYRRHGFYGCAAKARFYAASVVLAFVHLHERRIIYRDLKPENLLLDTRGFCKLADMGLAKHLSTGRTYTICGTPDYFAPEIVKNAGQTLALDWWTLGVLIHELLSGHAPFESADPVLTNQKITRGVRSVDFSAYQKRDPLAVDLVVGLLQQKPEGRLPMKGVCGVDLWWNIRELPKSQANRRMIWEQKYQYFGWAKIRNLLGCYLPLFTPVR